MATLVVLGFLWKAVFAVAVASSSWEEERNYGWRLSDAAARKRNLSLPSLILDARFARGTATARSFGESNQVKKISGRAMFMSKQKHKYIC